MADDARRAAELLREALSLWRGPPYAEFAYEPFAQAEIARLEESRLAALAGRIDAELRIGRARAAGGRARGARPRASLARAVRRPADARAISIGQAGRSARDLSRRPYSPGRGAGDRARVVSSRRWSEQFWRGTQPWSSPRRVPAPDGIVQSRVGVQQGAGCDRRRWRAPARGDRRDRAHVGLWGRGRRRCTPISFTVVSPGSNGVVGQGFGGHRAGGDCRGYRGYLGGKPSSRTQSDINPVSRTVVRTLAVGDTIDGGTAGEGQLWAFNTANQGSARRIDPTSGPWMKAVRLSPYWGTFPSTPTAAAVRSGLRVVRGRRRGRGRPLAGNGAIISTTNVGN